MGAAAAFAAIVLPTATAHAVDPWGGDAGPFENCDGAVCLVMDNPRDGGWTYSGIRPLLTDWKADHQAYTVEYTHEDGTVTDAGSYNVKIEDFWNPTFTSSAYQFGDFTANPDASDDLDLGKFEFLSGASMYKVTMLDGLMSNLTINNVGEHDLSYWVFTFGDYTNTVVTDNVNHVSADFVQIGDAAPQLLWNSLFHSDIPTVPDYLLPADPFAGLDFDPNDFLGGILANL
ncbi:hypothetical protein KIH27_12075 [Mycobacterium sp. M1]|uniref:Uncharacterized protein n=1 Tax=Mycolicibacter acidiphilus TaxID=2835306 RepID=A0ABS5RL60_9MYCO|nr:hypothetical protein [Mycolicibacter acidiphilus]MBS9534323.1 hypothetical protein [Mycolicibacter acidiphilus]